MSLVMSMLYPLFLFLDAYKWYFIIAIVVYIALTVTFKFARQAITIVFGILILFFILAHLPQLYSAMNGLLKDMGAASEASVNSYVDYVDENIMTDSSLSAAEKLETAIQYAIAGRPVTEEDKLPTSKDKDLSGTLDYIVNSTKWGSGIDGTGDPLPGPVDPVPEDANGFEKFAEQVKKFGKMIWDETKALFT